MKICLLGDISITSIHLLRWAKQFAQLGHEIHVISFGEAPVLKNIKVYQIKSKIPTKLKYITSIPAIRKIVKDINPDLIHAHYLSSYGFIGACLNFKPLVVSAWGSDILINPQKNLLLKLFTRFTLKRANITILMAKHMFQKLIKLGSSNDKIIIIPFGIDRDLIEWSKSKNLINKIDEKLIIISTRALEPIYNIELLIRATPYIIKKNKSVKCIIVGQGSQTKKLKKLARELGIINNILFLGQLSHNELLHQMENANIYVSTSLSDGCSTSLHEAMATGLFPVCTNIPANKDWIQNGANGFLIPINNPLELAQKILKAYENKNLLTKARKINWELINKHAVLDNNILKAEKIYQKLISLYK